ncbi:CDP-diacylglycerol--serine O-phosphatidyltransferase [Maritimibacter sp. 55A14]|uniref:CDP-diacylglycerol--serine O-phosphatidyltransferase n=1 Tax=Maritimibacter sp. 55A14 TaxID=2174844 RepID=UPI000D620BAB|nr:CDP-diacylglycerol--serine O-phosphatidyltransferase [Maritimibacter sp. 55A14]PWE33188.1 CDP-diacylglycerol--serine O-phosphatidyltransferase [Maritimibacter sp. 55A14]
MPGLTDGGEKPPRRSRRELPLFQFIPNLVTVGAICAGLTAIRFAAGGNFGVAVQLVLLAALLDGLDGHLARLLRSESALGAELDSLADFLSFGVAPALLMYFWAFGEMRNAGWIAVVIYALCCVLRLARFNVSSKSKPKGLPDKHFTGVPSPAGACLVLLPIFLWFMLGEDIRLPRGIIALHMVGVGLLMISRIPTYSLKSLNIRREHVPYLYIGFVCFLAALLSFPWAMLVALDIAYLGSVVWTWRRVKPAPSA